jgi:hypothetical protein
MNILFAFLVILVLLMGLISLFWPVKLQKLALKYNKMMLPGVPNPLYEWMKTADYLLMMRILGLVSIVAALLIGYGLYRTFIR